MLLRTQRLSPRLILAASGAVAAACFGTAHATLITYTAILDGPSESPPNASPGVGTSQVDVDTVAHTMHVHVDFSGLIGMTTASHIHAATALPGQGTAMVATQTPTFMGFPLGVTAGTYDNTFDMTMATSYNPAFITAHGGSVASAEAFLFQSFENGTAYLNIHTNTFPGGEIRGFLIPAPGAGALLGVAALSGMRRRRRWSL